MSIASARIQINGSWYSLTYNSSTGKWQATITAPSTTSYNQSGGYYACTVEATNTAGTKKNVTTSDATVGNSLKLVVKEKVAPVVTIVSPSSGAYVSNSQQPIVFTVTDETGGSGVNLSTLALKVDSGTAVGSSSMTCTAITNGYTVTYTPSSALSDGSHTVTINCSDHDGNAATQKSTTYTVDTTPPTLNVTSPTAGLITNKTSLTVAGTTNDATSSPVTIKIRLNGTDQGTVTVSSGSFSKAVTLTEGTNTLIVTATDKAGKTTSITRTVTLDTTVPVVSSVTISPNPVDTGGSVVISVVIS